VIPLLRLFRERIVSMRFASLGGFVLACLGMLVVPAASGAQPTKPPLPLLVPYGVQAGPGLRPPHGGRSPRVTPGGCEVDTVPDFIGITGGTGKASLGNFAGKYSGVLSGYSNEACSTSDAIAGGDLNVIGAAGDGTAASNSFIGSGAGNAIDSKYSFVGAGQNNDAINNYSFIGAGYGNTESGLYAFIGAGDGNTGSGLYSFIGAGENNGGSGNYSFVGAGDGNTASGFYTFVGAGENNTGSGPDSFVGAGQGNTESGSLSSIGAGYGNSGSGDDSFIGAGFHNSVSSYAFVGGGGNNKASGSEAFVGAGDSNAGSAAYSFVGGGSHNTIAGSAGYGTVGGGQFNAVGGLNATIPGGAYNTATGMMSLAAGYHADATHTGSFVWSDYVSGSSVVQDTAVDQFVVRASGGTYVYSSENLKAGVKLAAGSGTWASLSDRTAKTDIAPLDDSAVLAKVAALPVSTWRYKTESGVRHVGPMAQDFYAAFGVGEDDRHITSIDEDGVALAAIKALHAENLRLHAGTLRLQADNARLHAENTKLNDRLTALEKKVEALAAR